MKQTQCCYPRCPLLSGSPEIADVEKIDLSIEKLIEMALIHDLAEAVTGDIVTERGLEKAALVDRTKKLQLEREAFQQIFSQVEDGDDHLRLWQEFEENKSVEARLVKQLDKFEMAAQALEYEGNSWR